MTTFIAIIAVIFVVLGSMRDSDVILCSGVIIALIGYVADEIISEIESLRNDR